MEPAVGSSSTTPPYASSTPAERSIFRTPTHNRPSSYSTLPATNQTILRRGHSDGDVLAPHVDSRVGYHGDSVTEEAQGNGETWMDFLREERNVGHDGPARAKAAEVRRAVMVAADRRRRTIEQSEELIRRRIASGVVYGQHARDRKRHSVSGITNPLLPDLHTSEGSRPSLDTDRPLPHLPTNQPRTPGIGDFVLPQWQPDTEVSDCPICGKAFSFWYRKHHCRKCGRVVCANCSPHRITIPRQYIVHPPDDPNSGLLTRDDSVGDVVDLTDEVDDRLPAVDSDHVSGQHESSLSSAFGGGQEVRLCNPCVPDPNPMPPPTYTPRSRPHSMSHPGPTGSSDTGIASRVYSDASRPSPGLNFPFPSQPSGSSPSPSRRWHGHTPGMPQGPPPVPPHDVSNYGSVPDASSQLHNVSLYLSSRIKVINTWQQYLGPLLQQGRPHHARHRHHASTSVVPTHPRYRSMLDVETPLPPRPISQPRLREEDECPICHVALPPKGPDGSETNREAHVESCIQTHFSSSAPRERHPPPEIATSAAGAADSLTPAVPTQGEASSTPDRIRSTGEQLSGAEVSPSRARRRRVAGMLVYLASEKDCLGQDGESGQECVICFEDFAVGDEMGRLECLCKFHKVSTWHIHAV